MKPLHTPAVEGNLAWAGEAQCPAQPAGSYTTLIVGSLSFTHSLVIFNAVQTALNSKWQVHWVPSNTPAK